MTLLIYGVPILIGLALGYFLAWPALGFITAVAVALSIYWENKTGGGFIGITVISLLVMWVTFFVSSGVSLPSGILDGWLLRQ